MFFLNSAYYFPIKSFSPLLGLERQTLNLFYIPYIFLFFLYSTSNSNQYRKKERKVTPRTAIYTLCQPISYCLQSFRLERHGKFFCSFYIITCSFTTQPTTFLSNLFSSFLPRTANHQPFLHIPTSFLLSITQYYTPRTALCQFNTQPRTALISA